MINEKIKIRFQLASKKGLLKHRYIFVADLLTFKFRGQSFFRFIREADNQELSVNTYINSKHFSLSIVLNDIPGKDDCVSIHDKYSSTTDENGYGHGFQYDTW